VREVRGIEREDREEPITHSNRLIEREIGGLGEKLGAGEKRERMEQGGKLGARDKVKSGKRERGTDQGDQENQIGREAREEGAPLKVLVTPPPGAALSKASPCNLP
jgi:hypothetical protein